MAEAISFQRTLFQRASEQVKQGQVDAALQLLQAALRKNQLDAEGCSKAGRLIAKVRTASQHAVPSAGIYMLGQFTTSWLATSLTAFAWGRGVSWKVDEGNYDNVIQELLTPSPQLEGADVVLLAPWTQRLLGNSSSSLHTRITDELEQWQRAWDLVGNQGSRILQVGYDVMMPSALGFHLSGGMEGEVGLVRKMNEAMRSALPDNAYFVDLDQLAGSVGRWQFYDPRRYFWTKQPFSDTGLLHLVRHIFAGARALLTGPKKVLVLDLDDTLWGGVVGETGPYGVALGDSPDGEAFRAFQRHVKALGERGVVLAACSKNNFADAVSPFEQNPDMILRRHDFAHIEASWDPKAVGLRRIADALKLSLDSFVFFDDNPAEREHIRQSLPEVEVVDVSTDPAEYIRDLDAGLWFETVAVSVADKQRSLQYQHEVERRQLQQSLGSMEEYLQSLDMRATVADVNEANLQRVVQLLGKTNQFNLTTRRHSREQVEQLLRDPRAIGLTLQVTDRFGDHGLIAVLLGTPKDDEAEKTLRIDTWLMSCRVIGRTAEHFLFNVLIERARALGYRWLLGEFRPTAKNELVSGLYERLGFERLSNSVDGVTYKLSVDHSASAQTSIKLAA